MLLITVPSYLPACFQIRPLQKVLSVEGKNTAIVEVIAKEVMHDILSRLKESIFFSIQIDETTDVSVNQQCGVMLRFFDHIEGGETHFLCTGAGRKCYC